MTALLALGEIQTCLAPSSTLLSRPAIQELLELIPGRPVRWRERPGTLAVSDAPPVGVDCALVLDGAASAAGLVGTVAGRVIVVGGRLLQSSVCTRVVRAPARRRQTWSHYMSQIGTTELFGASGAREPLIDALTAGYLDGPATAETLDLASIGDRLLLRLRADPCLDQLVPLSTGTTRLRWTARIGGATGPALGLRLDDGSVRSAWFVVRHAAELESVPDFCADLAVHDWLLTAVGGALEQADRFPAGAPQRGEIPAAVLQHLASLWMPGAHSPAGLRGLWKGLQSDPGFSRQWTASIGQVRDRLSVAQWHAHYERGTRA
ncbi:SCO2521 family protein [Nocardia brasiliensis]|uniref:SCO2521 family protein n=1 Tax=Nocardia brasiliensis TaxID=37326 RepID=UPI003D90E8F5